MDRIHQYQRLILLFIYVKKRQEQNILITLQYYFLTPIHQPIRSFVASKYKNKQHIFQKLKLK